MAGRPHPAAERELYPSAFCGDFSRKVCFHGRSGISSSFRFRDPLGPARLGAAAGGQMARVLLLGLSRPRPAVLPENLSWQSASFPRQSNAQPAYRPAVRRARADGASAVGRGRGDGGGVFLRLSLPLRPRQHHSPLRLLPRGGILRGERPSESPPPSTAASKATSTVWFTNARITAL